MRYSEYYVEHCAKKRIIPLKAFIEWINQIENAVLQCTECNLLDLPDEPYMIWFESGKTVDDASRIVVNNYTCALSFMLSDKEL